MKRLHIFITSIIFTVSLGWFSSASGKLVQPTRPLSFQLLAESY